MLTRHTQDHPQARCFTSHTVHAARKVPATICTPKLKTELSRMETMGVIEKVTHPTEWVNSIVVVEKKNGSLRVCLDPKDLNQAIQRSHYKLITHSRGNQFKIA